MWFMFIGILLGLMLLKWISGFISLIIVIGIIWFMVYVIKRVYWGIKKWNRHL